MESRIVNTLPHVYLSWGSDWNVSRSDCDSSNTHVVLESHELNSIDTENGEEEYLEIDYAEEIEDCSRYTFSESSYYCNQRMPNHMDLPRDGCSDGYGASNPIDERQWLKQQKLYYLADCAEAQQRWVQDLQRQQENFIQKHSRPRLMIIIAEARRQNIACLRSINSTPKEVEEAEQRWQALARRISAESANLTPRECRDMISAMSLFKSPEEATLSAQDMRVRRERVLEQLRERQELFFRPVASDETAETLYEEVGADVPEMESPHMASLVNADTPLDFVVVLPPMLSLFDVSDDKSSGTHELADAFSPDSSGGASSSDSGSDCTDFADECYSHHLFFSGLHDSPCPSHIL